MPCAEIETAQDIADKLDVWETHVDDDHGGGDILNHSWRKIKGKIWQLSMIFFSLLQKA